MKLSDLIGTCINNLLRHKGRTILTVIGVVVGCCSVIIMISFGVAMKISLQSFLDSMGDLTVIEVSPKGGKSLDDNSVKELKGLENAAAVMPQYKPDGVEINIRTSDGRYVCRYTDITGYDTSGMEAFGYRTSQGSLFGTGKENSVVMGKYTAYEFADTMRPEGRNTIDYWVMYQDDGTVADPPDPYFDPMTTQLQMVLSAGEGTSETVIDLNVAGMFEENTGGSYVTASGFVMDTKELIALVNKYKKENGISTDGKMKYESIQVKADDISHVSSLDTAIKALGYETYSMESMRKSVEKEANQNQLLFAGLGVVSLFVAALGIMNTMIMAISERTREIGVMKAMGCFVNDIRKIFLFEAGFIGLIGGIIGSVSSIILSHAINIITMHINLKTTPWAELKVLLFESTERISVVPWQLALGAVGFSILVGVAAGFYPANRAATKISALEAIKTE